jgi:uncharacterized repeat protein (TIGR03803 family)
MRAQSWKPITYAAAVCLALTSSTVSQTVKDLVAFSGANNLTYPGSTPVQGRDGKFYSTINGGGNAGSIFDFTASGAHSVVYALDFTNGWNPFGMVLGTDGSFYGITANGGSLSYGVLFKVTSSGAYSVLHNFTGGTDGTGPTGTPIEASDGNFYGTTNGGCCHVSTVYKYTRSGVFSTIYTYDSAHGTNATSILQGSDGDLYVIAGFGGAYGNGTIVQLTTAGKLLSYYSFPGGSAGGGFPIGMTQASDGNYYGTTYQGGVAQQGGIGTIFRYTPKTGATVIYTYEPQQKDGGGFPSSGLTQGTDGWLYGVTLAGGTDGYGTVFRINMAGTYQQLYSFTSAVGQAPDANLLQATSGLFYGAAQNGGPYGYGAMFSLNMGLGPFITFVQPTGKVGQAVQILGQGLKGTTSVTFNGIAATSFKVANDTFMTAVVPSGATTGKVVVTTPSGPLTSNVNFRIIQ